MRFTDLVGPENGYFISDFSLSLLVQ